VSFRARRRPRPHDVELDTDHGFLARRVGDVRGEKAGELINAERPHVQPHVFVAPGFAPAGPPDAEHFLRLGAQDVERRVESHGYGRWAAAVPFGGIDALKGPFASPSNHCPGLWRGVGRDAQHLLLDSCRRFYDFLEPSAHSLVDEEVFDREVDQDVLYDLRYGKRAMMLGCVGDLVLGETCGV